MVEQVLNVGPSSRNVAQVLLAWPGAREKLRTIQHCHRPEQQAGASSDTVLPMIRQTLMKLADPEKRTLPERRNGRLNMGPLDMGPLLRIAGWGLAAAAALAIAVFAGRSEIGQHRAAIAMNPALSEATRLATTQALTRAEQAEREAHRLAETVESLSADRDKLLNRVASLERSLEDLTGSISLTRPARRPAAADLLLAQENKPNAPTQQPDATLPTGSLPGQASLGRTPPKPGAPMLLAPDHAWEPGSAPVARGIPVPRADPRRTGEVASPAPAAAPSPIAAGEPPAPEAPSSPPAREAVAPVASSTALGSQAGKRHGIDLGSATSIEGLRALWKKIQQSRTSPLLADLKPVVSVHDAAQPGSVELRLVAGPVPSALAASRLCAALSAAGTPCRATTFDGQSLAAR
jgi:hypothetical protein